MKMLSQNVIIMEVEKELEVLLMQSLLRFLMQAKECIIIACVSSCLGTFHLVCTHLGGVGGVR